MKVSRTVPTLDRRQFLSAGLTSVASPLLLAGGVHAQENGSAQTAQEAYPPAANDALRFSASRRGLRFGSAIRSDILRQSPEETGFFVAECSSITPEWEMKWNSMAYSSEQHDFSDCDLIVDFARRHGLAVRGHTLLWHQAIPDWALQRIEETQDWSIIANHIQAVVSRYEDAVDEWDVVNEPIDAYGPDGLRENLFLRAYGRDYIEMAIRLAHEIAPDARMFINDYSLEYEYPEEHGRRLALIGLAERLLSRGVPLGGIGVQAHLDLRKGTISESDIDAFFSAIGSLGLDIAITELDVRESDILLPIEERDRMVSATVKRYLDVALAHPAVTSVSTWGLSDAHSWLAQPPQGHPWNRGVLYDQYWQAKPMRTALSQAFG
ncbi:endo-1,4-beta-xylanase [Pelagibacterium lacus]|uniref:Beta-xylanase n=1 Tax=Pelagibacterium lacus TaxID=2282655 RepID=A0A369W3P9_9HYPH|nr:endo-1,4-beta-xylanase [Pelagibacterium lacus]RDE09168.1 hypothetical protein DVH29_08230 [Pelagibacterium lacus]